MYYASAALSELNHIRHGFFTRNGGVSTGVYQSLNCGRGSGDEPAAVLRNLAIIQDSLGSETDIFIGKQVHGKNVFYVDQAALLDPLFRPEADAVVTAIPGVAIGVLTADCVPVLFADSQNKVIGAAHAGRKGAIVGVIGATIEAMEKLGADRKNISAAIGPAISLKNYEVGEEIKQEMIASDCKNEKFFLEKDRKLYLNLPQYVNCKLIDEKISVIDAMNLCTYDERQDFFSYRRATHQKESDYGRQISAIALVK